MSLTEVTLKQIKINHYIDRSITYFVTLITIFTHTELVYAFILFIYFFKDFALISWIGWLKNRQETGERGGE